MRLMVIGSHNIGAIPKGVDMGQAQQDAAQDQALVFNNLSTFEPVLIVHADRDTPFEKLVDRLCSASGWENVRLHPNQLAQNLGQLDGVVAFRRPGTGDAIRLMEQHAEAQGVQVVEFTV